MERTARELEHIVSGDCTYERLLELTARTDVQIDGDWRLATGDWRCGSARRLSGQGALWVHQKRGKRPQVLRLSVAGAFDCRQQEAPTLDNVRHPKAQPTTPPHPPAHPDRH